MDIKIWVNNINYQMPDYRQIYNKYAKLNMHDDKEKLDYFINDFLINRKLYYYEDKVLTIDIPINELLEKTNIRESQICGIDFFTIAERDDDIIDCWNFAIHNDYYTFGIKNNQVIMHNEENEIFEKISPDLEKFLFFLQEANKYFMKAVFGVDFNKSESEKNLQYLKLQGVSDFLFREFVYVYE